jgi:glycosyltransferase involved in cell wall biosynthesis
MTLVIDPQLHKNIRGKRHAAATELQGANGMSHNGATEAPATLSIVMPIYNEEDSLVIHLSKVVEFCKAHDFELILVNDGSRDNSGKLINAVKGGKVKAVHNKLNKGYGGAIKEGIKNATSDYVITIDGDGQHSLEDVIKLFELAKEKDADMIVGNRNINSSGLYRQFGKWLLRRFAKMLMPIPIDDLNSGMKIYRTDLAKKYIPLCSNSMAYSDMIALVFISQRHLVAETPITILARENGKSTINTLTAFQTLKEILNIVVLFNPMKVFFPVSLFTMLISLAWGIPLVLKGNGVSVGAMLGVVSAIIFFFFGLLAEQLSMIRKNNL